MRPRYARHYHFPAERELITFAKYASRFCRRAAISASCSRRCVRGKMGVLTRAASAGQKKPRPGEFVHYWIYIRFGLLRVVSSLIDHFSSFDLLIASLTKSRNLAWRGQASWAAGIFGKEPGIRNPQTREVADVGSCIGSDWHQTGPAAVIIRPTSSEGKLRR